MRMQGIVNNLRGFRGELQAAQEAPGVGTAPLDRPPALTEPGQGWAGVGGVMPAELRGHMHGQQLEWRLLLPGHPHS